MGKKQYLALMAALMWLVLWLPSAFAEAIEDDLNFWGSVTLELPVTEKATIKVDSHARLDNNIRDMSLVIVRPGLYYDINDHVNVATGYAWVPQFNPERNENRLWQQVAFKHSGKFIHLDRLIVDHRFRVEERLIEDAASTSVRGRYRLLLRHPIAQSPWYVVSSDELFINVTSTSGGAQSGFDQNRLFVGIGRQFHESLRGEMGYLWQSVNRPSPATDRFNHALVVNLFWKPIQKPLLKK